jgi:hypothetical protein
MVGPESENEGVREDFRRERDDAVRSRSDARLAALDDDYVDERMGGAGPRSLAAHGRPGKRRKKSLSGRYEDDDDADDYDDTDEARAPYPTRRGTETSIHLQDILDIAKKAGDKGLSVKELEARLRKKGYKPLADLGQRMRSAKLRRISSYPATIRYVHPDSKVNPWPMESIDTVETENDYHAQLLAHMNPLDELSMAQAKRSHQRGAVGGDYAKPTNAEVRNDTAIKALKKAYAAHREKEGGRGVSELPLQHYDDFGGVEVGGIPKSVFNAAGWKATGRARDIMYQGKRIGGGKLTWTHPKSNLAIVEWDADYRVVKKFMPNEDVDEARIDIFPKGWRVNAMLNLKEKIGVKKFITKAMGVSGGDEVKWWTDYLRGMFARLPISDLSLSFGSDFEASFIVHTTRTESWMNKRVAALKKDLSTKAKTKLESVECGLDQMVDEAASWSNLQSVGHEVTLTTDEKDEADKIERVLTNEVKHLKKTAPMKAVTSTGLLHVTRLGPKTLTVIARASNGQAGLGFILQRVKRVPGITMESIEFDPIGEVALDEGTYKGTVIVSNPKGTSPIRKDGSSGGIWKKGEGVDVPTQLRDEGKYVVVLADGRKFLKRDVRITKESVDEAATFGKPVKVGGFNLIRYTAHGGSKEEMWLVLPSTSTSPDDAIGFVTKWRDTKTEKNPWKAFRYKSPGGGESNYLGATYKKGKAGKTVAVQAAGKGTKLSESDDAVETDYMNEAHEALLRVMGEGGMNTYAGHGIDTNFTPELGTTRRVSPRLGRGVNTDRSADNENKVTKDDANYKPAEDDRKCGRCVYFNAKDKLCRLVAGPINADDTCDLFKPHGPHEDVDVRKGEAVVYRYEMVCTTDKEAQELVKMFTNISKGRTVKANRIKRVVRSAHRTVDIHVEAYNEQNGQTYLNSYLLAFKKHLDKFAVEDIEIVPVGIVDEADRHRQMWGDTAAMGNKTGKLIGYWQDLAAYYDFNGTAFAYHHSGRSWVNKGKTEKVKADLKAGKLRGKLVESDEGVDEDVDEGQLRPGAAQAKVHGRLVGGNVVQKGNKMYFVFHGKHPVKGGRVEKHSFPLTDPNVKDAKNIPAESDDVDESTEPQPLFEGVEGGDSQDISVRNYDNDTEDVPGKVFGKYVGVVANGRDLTEHCYDVIHVPTGMRLCSWVGNGADAQKLAEMYANLGDKLDFDTPLNMSEGVLKEIREVDANYRKALADARPDEPLPPVGKPVLESMDFDIAALDDSLDEANAAASYYDADYKWKATGLQTYAYLPVDAKTRAWAKSKKLDLPASHDAVMNAARTSPESGTEGTHGFLAYNEKMEAFDVSAGAIIVDDTGDSPELQEVSPPGFSGTVDAMKAGGVDEPQAFKFAWSMYKKGVKPKKKPKANPAGLKHYVPPEAYAEMRRKMKAEGIDFSDVDE